MGSINNGEIKLNSDGHFLYQGDHYEAALRSGFRREERGIFVSKSVFHAFLLSKREPVGLSEAVSAQIEQIIRTRGASRATDTAQRYACAHDVEYMPHQKAAIKFAQGKNGVLIADKMGLGKTMSAIGIATQGPLSDKVLVICPSSLRLNWMREWEKWDHRSPKIQVISKGTDEIDPSCHVFIVSYNIAAKRKIRELKEVSPKFVILDECHYLKNRESDRTRAILKSKVLKAAMVIALSGTPIPNKPIELWALLKSISPKTIDGMSYSEYAKRFCGAYIGRWGLDVNGATRLKELGFRLRSTCMIARTYKEVFPRSQTTPMPPSVVLISDDGVKKLIQQEQELCPEDLNSHDFTNKKKYRNPNDLRGDYAKVRKELALRKTPQVLDILEEQLENGIEQLVIFAHHKDVISLAKERLEKYGVGVIDGSTSSENKQRVVDKFQEGGIRVFIGNIQAAGVGHTLTSAHHVRFLEFSWVPGENEQAIGRCDRIGQKERVVTQYFVFDKSLDARMLKRALAKNKTINKLME